MLGSIFRRKWTTVDYVLIVVTAALYAVAILLLAGIKIIPGVPIRPGNALQPVFGILFGLPGCIGLGLGNLVSDMLQANVPPHAMILGVVVNFLGGFLPLLFVSHPALKTKRSWVEYYIFVVLITSAVIAAAPFVNVALGLTPKPLAVMLMSSIFPNQALATAILGPILLKLLFQFVKRSGLYRGRTHY